MAKLAYSQDLAGALGANGLAEDRLLEIAGALAPTLERLQADRRSGASAVLALPDRTDDLDQIDAAAARIGDGADVVVVLGTGGSSLGGQTLTRLADHGFGPRPGRPKIIFFDNVDPATFEAFFQTADAARTRFISVSKSGGTAETLLQTLTCLAWMRAKVGADAAAAAFTILTEPKDSPITRLGAENGMAMLEHDQGVGGRFSVLSNVGLLPAALAGLDVRAIRAGAATALDASLTVAATDSPAALGAALNIGLWRERGMGITVLMPYVDALAPLAFWFRQLWAESLGKDGNGTLPANALGTVDQHSQLQLYLAGPNDKLFSLILADPPAAASQTAPLATSDPDLAYLNGRPLGDLLDAEQRATAEALIRNRRPTRIFRVAAADEASLGALLGHYELETILAADLLGVDPFDQPAVEEGKVLARQYLDAARPGS